MKFLEEGFTPSFFWSLSLYEVQDVLRCLKKQQREKLKEKALMSYIHGKQIGEYIARITDTKNEVQISKIWDLYPGMFDDEKNIYEKVQEEEEFENYKRRKIAFARYHNERFGGDDD